VLLGESNGVRSVAFEVGVGWSIEFVSWLSGSDPCGGWVTSALHTGHWNRIWIRDPRRKQEPLTSFFRWISHSSTSLRWKMWWQGNTRTLSPLAYSERQMAHSNCDSNQGWLWRDVDASSRMTDDFCVGRRPSRSTPAERVSGTAFASSPPSCFSQCVPVHTCHGKLRTISSGARSRWAARAARIRWMRSVMNVSAEGRRRMTTNAMIGLEKVEYADW